VPAHRSYATIKLSQDADFIARDVWYHICLKMQNVIAKKPRNVLLYFI